MSAPGAASTDAGGDTARELAALALAVARDAAALVRERSAGGVSVADTKTSPIDIVTEVDRASEELIRARLRAARPDDAILGEEGDDVAGTSGVRWVVDPIDGTVNFLYGLPQFAVSIAAERDGEVVAGVVLRVATGTEYVACLDPDGTGDPATSFAERDGEPLRVREPVPLDRQLLITGFSYRLDVRAHQLAALSRLGLLVRDVRRLGSSALDLCTVAEGRADGYFEEGVHLWDHAAGALVARVAGARTVVTRGTGGEEMIVCAPEGAAETLLEALRSTGSIPE